MSQIEKKFAVSEEVRDRILADAEFLGKWDYTDTYLDTVNYALTTQDIWLRSRGALFQLKLPIRKNLKDNKRLASYYDQLDTDSDIREQLKLAPDASLAEDIEAAGYVPVASFTTTRSKHRKEGFIIDEDYVDFDYRMVKIRVEEDEGEANEVTEKKIMDFAARYKLVEVPLRQKVIESIKRFNPTHYNALAAAGLVDKREGLLGGILSK